MHSKRPDDVTFMGDLIESQPSTPPPTLETIGKAMEDLRELVESQGLPWFHSYAIQEKEVIPMYFSYEADLMQRVFWHV